MTLTDATESSTPPERIVDGGSLWDRLPAEMRDRVVRVAGPLTQVLHGGSLRRGDDRAWLVRAAWVEALATDWSGDLRLIPAPDESSGLDESLAERVRDGEVGWSGRSLLGDGDVAAAAGGVSREMYGRLCARLPQCAPCDSSRAFNRAFATQRQVESELNNLDPSNSSTTSLMRLIHIPLRNVWLDVIGSPVAMPYARAYDAIELAHEELLALLIDSHAIDPKKLVFMPLRSSDSPVFGTRRNVAAREDACARVMDVAAASGSVRNLSLLHASGCSSVSVAALEYAAANGHLAAVQWICVNLPELRNCRALDLAATNGHLHVVEWLHASADGAVPCTHAAMDGAAENGFIDIVKFLHTNRSEGCTTKAMDSAASGNHFEIVRFLHENRSQGCTIAAMDNAARFGHFEMVQFLHTNRTEGCSTKAMDNAAWSGHIDIVKFLHENRTEGCTTRAMENAAYWGQLATVKWLHENRREGCTTEAMDEAASHGHLDVVKWLHANRTEGCTTNAMTLAAQHGHLDVVKWLHENRSEGCSSYAIGAASASGHSDVVQFLLESGRSECTFAALASAATSEIARTLVASLGEERRVAMLAIAERKNQRVVMKHLRDFQVDKK